MERRGWRALVLIPILVELIPIPSYPAWTMRPANWATRFPQPTSMRLRIRRSTRMGQWAGHQRRRGSKPRALEVLHHSLTTPPQKSTHETPSDLAEELDSATDLIRTPAAG